MRDGMALRTQMRGSASGWLDEGLREMRSGRFPRESHQILKKEEESDQWEREGQSRQSQ